VYQGGGRSGQYDLEWGTGVGAAVAVASLGATLLGGGGALLGEARRGARAAPSLALAPVLGASMTGLSFSGGF
jgi:hypothetical protein